MLHRISCVLSSGRFSGIFGGPFEVKVFNIKEKEFNLLPQAKEK